MMIKTIQTPAMYRGFEIERAEDESGADDYRISFPFSSELEVGRSFGGEILDHAPSSVRMDWVASGRAPLLLDHETGQQIGVIESASIGGDRRGHAVARFSKSALAEEIRRDVIDGIRANVSVGYRIHEMRLEGETDGEAVYRATDWEPFEVSIVSIPADQSVGVGRDNPANGDTFQTIIRGLKQMDKDENKPAVAPAVPAVPVDANKVRADARKAEQVRIREIQAIGDQFGLRELAGEAVGSGVEVSEFRGQALDALAKGAGNKAITVQRAEDPAIGMSEKEAKSFSFVRAMRALANPQDRKAQELAGFEWEASRAAAEKSGREAAGIIVPVDVLRMDGKRDLNVGTATAGGNLVSTDLLAGSFIDLLRNRMALMGAGATMLQGLNGNIAIPRQSGGATAYWISSEGGAPTESAQTIAQVSMTPNTVGAYTDFTRNLLLQSSIDVEAFVRGDLAKVLALAIDDAALEGSGASGQPTGVKNTAGIGSTTFAAAVPTWAEVVGLETAVAAANADEGTVSYLMNATMRGSLKTTEKASGTARFIWDDISKEVNGYAPHVTNQATDGDLYFGNWADVLIGMWGGLDLTVDPYSASTTGTVRVVALQSADIAVRHAESFALGNDGV